MLIFPWLDLIDNLVPVSKEEIERAQKLKPLIKANKRYNLSFKYKEDK